MILVSQNLLNRVMIYLHTIETIPQKKILNQGFILLKNQALTIEEYGHLDLDQIVVRS